MTALGVTTCGRLGCRRARASSADGRSVHAFCDTHLLEVLGRAFAPEPRLSLGAPLGPALPLSPRAAARGLQPSAVPECELRALHGDR